jgi:hypothetical protein
LGAKLPLLPDYRLVLFSQQQGRLSGFRLRGAGPLMLVARVSVLVADQIRPLGHRMWNSSPIWRPNRLRSARWRWPMAKGNVTPITAAEKPEKETADRIEEQRGRIFRAMNLVGTTVLSLNQDTHQDQEARSRLPMSSWMILRWN